MKIERTMNVAYVKVTKSEMTEFHYMSADETYSTDDSGKYIAYVQGSTKHGYYGLTPSVEMAAEVTVENFLELTNDIYNHKIPTEIELHFATVKFNYEMELVDTFEEPEYLAKRRARALRKLNNDDIRSLGVEALKVEDFCRNGE